MTPFEDLRREAENALAQSDGQLHRASPVRWMRRVRLTDQNKRDGAIALTGIDRLQHSLGQRGYG